AQDYLIKQEKAIYTGTVANRNALLAEVKKADGV
ncbi:MAG: HD domain-containing protein, partial [Megasphaera micronuciformis]|nr:HD domain-containing protein [Megasphaera micronuciformis]